MVGEGESVRACNEHSCAGTHHIQHELEATLEGASVLEHRPQPLLHSPASQLVVQVLFPCAAAQHDAAPPRHNSKAQAQAHSHSEHSDPPRPQAQRPASYYICSEGGVIKHEVRKFFKDLLNSGLVTQLPVQQPKLQFPDMSAFDSSGQPCYLTALHVHNAGRWVSLFACWASGSLFAGWQEIVSLYLLADDCLFLRAERVIISSCLLLASDCVFFLGVKRVWFFACPQANLFDSLLYTRSGCLALLCCLLHARPLPGTHSRSLSLEFSRACTLARVHLLAGESCCTSECLFLLAGQKLSLDTCWQTSVSFYVKSERLSLFACCWQAIVFFFFWCQASVFFCLQAGESFWQSRSLSHTSLPFPSLAYSLTVCVVIGFSYKLADWSWGKFSSSGMCPRLSLQRRPSVETCSRQFRTLICPRLTPTSPLHPKQRTSYFRQPSSPPFAPTSWDRNILISSLKMMM